MKSQTLIVLGGVLIAEFFVTLGILLSSILNSIAFLFIAVLGFPVGLLFVSYFYDRIYGCGYEK